MKYLLSYGSADSHSAIVNFTTVSQNVRLLRVYVLYDALVHAMANVQQRVL